jgi:hypothetical protein
LPKKSFYALHSEPKHFFGPSDFSTLIADPEIIGSLAHFAQASRQGAAVSRPPQCLGGRALRPALTREGGDAAGCLIQRNAF